jgi:transposase-like protein
MSIHYRAMAHLEKAKELLAKNDEDSLRYAALEIRYCIEHLFYELIPLYKQELPDDVMNGKVWKPGDIIAMISEIDPGVLHDRTLTFGSESSPGVLAGPMYVMGTHTGLRRDLARRIWNGVGFYLHAPVISGEHDYDKLRKKLAKTIPRLQTFQSDRVLAGGFAERSHFKCSSCGRAIAKRTATIEETPWVVCPNTKCGAIYECFHEGDQVGHKMLQESVKCKKCGSDNWLGVHQLKEAAQKNGFVRCCQCDATYQLFEYVLVKDAKPEDVERVARAKVAPDD